MKNIPAFPVEVIYTQDNKIFNGMTLRDYFAIRAMQAFESRQDVDDIHLTDKVKRAYYIADAMMKAREE